MTDRRTTTHPEDALTDEQGHAYFLGAAYGPRDAAVHRQVMERLQAMTPEEFLGSLVAAGIYGPEGRLRPPYTDEPDETTAVGANAVRAATR